MRRMLSGLAAVALIAAAARAAEVNPLLPKETEQVMHVNFKQMLDSDLIKKYAKAQFEQMLKSDQTKAVTQAFGIDPMKDLERLTVGVWGKDDDMNVVGVLKGTFDAAKLYEAAKAEAAKNADKVSVEDAKDGDQEFKVVKVTNDKGKPFFLTVADDKTVVGATDKKDLAAALTAANKKEKAKLGKQLTDLVLKQDEKATMFFCGVVEGKLGDIPGDFSQLSAVGIDGDKLKKQLSKMTTMAATVRLEKEVALDLTMGMKDADAADEFSGSLDKLVDTAKQFLPLLAGQQPKTKLLVSDLTETLKTKSKDKDVTFGFKLSAKALAAAAGQDE